MKHVNRRGFLAASALAAGSAGIGAALGERSNGSEAHADETAGLLATRGGLLDAVAFDGAHQAGILTPPQPQATFVALDATAVDRGELQSTLQALSFRARTLAQGQRTLPGRPDDPAADSGTLGTVVAPDSLTVTIGFGASLFDDRYGLASRRPRALTTMPAFPNDTLDPAQSHGDVLVQICAGQRDTVVHALRALMATVHGNLELRWMIDGFQSAARGPSPKSSPRNLFAFRDGTANPDVADAKLMNQLVWTPADGDHPGWRAGGTVQVVRIIRMHVEFWDRVGLREQEQMIGRARDSGAPLGAEQEFQNPRYDLDPKGARIPLDAHIRLANPRTAPTAGQRILRRGYNYQRGFDPAGALDQGLIFSAFNRDPAAQFAPVQLRLADEPMTDYISPVGGGYFFLPPGTGGAQGYIGDALFT